ncbi:thymidine phosphorylase family protein [Aquicella lusitana]|uniref:Putative thymidine phosphorylase n=1 Tax=Aquicella lusitana TaxID=254246 RepID=A0A370GHZ2_9COXI|nr:thymidine phosphorylase family protein [Aquicella lusitana]RDI43425.1 thymidine phosphorylase [Aquicella lusitana]VVC73575.1 Pyrimidine-nucleoside phosphorylase [Aquicella lusitana]
MNTETNKLQLVRLGINTRHEFVIYMHVDCFVCKSEGFEAQKQIVVTFNNSSIVATLNIIQSGILSNHEASLSESAWKRLGVQEGDYISLSHLKPVTSLKYLRSKIYGNEMNAHKFQAIMADIVAGKYSNIHLSSFITACAKDNLSIAEMIDLTQAMVQTGERVIWEYPLVMDKHSVGGIPGNRTTPIVVAIVAAAGLIIPKTSSRAITSPAGTADTLETMTPVDLSLTKMQKVVRKEGGCFAWGGAINLSPADDIIIRVERSLDLDPEGQMVASVLSKKAAAGATHVIIDMPVGPTAKIRSDQIFLKLQDYFIVVGKAVGLNVKVLKTDGIQPLGIGIGPALEAKDILSVLQNEKDAPADLKNKAIVLAACLLEQGKKASPGAGQELAKKILESGAAFKKFLAICEAQGGFREPQRAPYTHDIVAAHEGIVTEIDNRNLAMVAKLAGAPHDATAGIEFFAKRGTKIEIGQILYRIHAESTGELAYSLSFAQSMPNIIKISREGI